MSENTPPPQVRYNDCLDDVTPRGGMPWKRFNEIVRRVRDVAIARGRPLPGRQHVMAAMLEFFEVTEFTTFDMFATMAIDKRTADDIKRRGTRVRGLVARYRMGPR